MTPLGLRLLLPLARALVWVFYRRVEIRGAEQVPAEGPLLFAANHPNMAVDALLLWTSQPRAISFLAKASLFNSRLLGTFLDSIGVLPVYRRSDNPQEMGKNLLTFQACFRHLERGGAIGIFPEGSSHVRQAVLPLKTGCARIALEAEERNGFRLGVKIVPVGLYLPERHIFRSDALVVFGPALDPAVYFDRYRANPQQAVRELTADLEQAIRELIVHVPRPEDEVLLARLRQIFQSQEGVAARLEVDRALVEAIEHFRDVDPARYQLLRREVLRYGRLLATLSLAHPQVGRRYRFGPVLRYLAPRLTLAAAGLPLFLFGALNNFLAYKIPAWTARLVSRDVVEMATVKLLSGLVSFPFFYSIQTWLVVREAGPFAGIIYLCALPLSGLGALRYQEAMRGLIEEVRVFSLHFLRRDLVRRLEQRSEILGRELARCREEYLSRAQQPAAGHAAPELGLKGDGRGNTSSLRAGHPVAFRSSITPFPD